MSVPSPTPSTPPLESPWELPLHRAPLVFFDLELTGSDPLLDEPVELSFVRTEGTTETQHFTTLVRPSREVSPGAAQVHHIAPEALASAQSFATHAARVRALLTGAVLVGHNPVLDRAALERSFAQCGLEPPPLAWMLDTMVLARRAVSARTYALGPLCEALGLSARATHRAEPDARATMALFWHLAPRLDGRSGRDLWEVRVGQKTAVLVRAEIEAALRAAVGTGKSVGLVLRRAGEGERVLRAQLERYQAPYLWITQSSGQLRILRADRLLRLE